MTKIELGGENKIDSDPTLHQTPNYCPECRVFYYFGHNCL